MEKKTVGKTNPVLWLLAYIVLLSPLLLAGIVGYYFGFRAGVKSVAPLKIQKKINYVPINKQSGQLPTVVKPSTSYRGKVSFYTNRYCELYNPGCKTASGEVFDDTKFTAACANRFKLGTRLLVRAGNNSVTVYCNDRGSFEESYGRVLDLSKSAFAALAPTSKGVLEVDYQIID